ncbi:MAG: 1-acyl-sn-glycerol-3-phosphate acyltransferase [Kineosporiaceae bacterium]|nr:1-acyl-sn-glycerol-3-phosphate acyltransferase [Kineosporiaceae bacterium]
MSRAAVPPRHLSGAYRVAEGLLRPPLTFLTRRDWRGGENLPRTGGFVAAGNHVSHIDPLTFAHFLLDHGCPPRFLGKESVFRVPVVGRIVTAAGQIPVLRESSDAGRALAAAMEGVRAGECVAIYPEATLSRDPALWPMVGKTGAARVALSTGAPVIPIAQWGPQQLLPPYSLRLRFWRSTLVHVWAGPAVDLSAYHDRPLDGPTLRAATADIMAAITQLLERIRGEKAPAERWDPRAHGQPLTGNPRKRIAPGDPPAEGRTGT